MQTRKTHKDKDKDNAQSTASVKPDAAEVVAPAVVPAVAVPAMHQGVSFVCVFFVICACHHAMHYASSHVNRHF